MDNQENQLEKQQTTMSDTDFWKYVWSAAIAGLIVYVITRFTDKALEKIF